MRRGPVPRATARPLRARPAAAPATPPPPAARGPPAPARATPRPRGRHRRAADSRSTAPAAALAGLAVTNVLLILLTLGVYHYFWAKTLHAAVYVLGETELEGDRFAYHGTGRELLVGARGAAVLRCCC